MNNFAALTGFEPVMAGGLACDRLNKRYHIELAAFNHSATEQPFEQSSKT